ncbi:MAG: hypothetical protein HRJ53_01110 [Acidobacteria bacterium Pan2503]|uniref:Uncharacterized protein n=1 Tax=Candidatus Acidiferrum panamense TaxID=2741543 RepID=A0A7V8NLI0_9BACT|nr:hypothetical protein [Candidatus Acidoferrum panamensis]
MDIGEVKLMTRQREQIDEVTARWACPNRHAKRGTLAAVHEFLRSRSVTTRALD